MATYDEPPIVQFSLVCVDLLKLLKGRRLMCTPENYAVHRYVHIFCLDAPHQVFRKQQKSIVSHLPIAIN